MDELEQKLREMPMRAIPADWKQDILGSPVQAKEKVLSWHFWLWPSPRAWTAVAAVWLMIGLLNYGTSRLHALPTSLAQVNEHSRDLLLLQQEYFRMSCLKEVPAETQSDRRNDQSLYLINPKGKYDIYS